MRVLKTENRVVNRDMDFALSSCIIIEMNSTGYELKEITEDKHHFIIAFKKSEPERILLKLRHDWRYLSVMEKERGQTLDVMMMRYLTNELKLEDDDYDYDETVVFESKVSWEIGNMAFCKFYEIYDYRSKRLYGVSADDYRVIQRMYDNFMVYMRLYLWNKEDMDRVIRKELVKRETGGQVKYNLFMDTLYNPFQSSKELGVKYGIADDEVRHHLLECYRTLCDEFKHYRAGGNLVYFFLMRWKLCLYGRLKRTPGIKKYPRR